ncbi:hypothetical protein CDCA_CDCA14G3895 [Cyanidium caldarium]|uniref:Uncharacterized protein n=1 Tax=Cyanidium caldarium TaxID=2771 RepID=A0AAV9J0M6_CYACA|nr:hypothetical protein CDCA_CDCA14G3895 [Cyanidium caldarium]
MYKFTLALVLILASFLSPASPTFGAALGSEFLINRGVTKNNMAIVPNHLIGIELSPMPPGMPTGSDVIHLEVDVHATAGNPWGFPEKAWIPYLSIVYLLEKDGSDWRAEGVMHPMTADGGPHYADSLRMDGSGSYRLTYRLSPPRVNGFLRHVDNATGVPEWWDPFEERFNFTYPIATPVSG